MSLPFAIALPTIIVALAASRPMLPLTPVAETTFKEVIVAQLRKQGYRCNKAVNAERDSQHPDEKGAGFYSVTTGRTMCTWCRAGRRT